MVNTTNNKTMKTLQEEAENYSYKLYHKGMNWLCKHKKLIQDDFIAGATFDYVHNEIIKGKIEVLEDLKRGLAAKGEIKAFDITYDKINGLKQQLK